MSESGSGKRELNLVRPGNEGLSRVQIESGRFLVTTILADQTPTDDSWIAQAKCRGGIIKPEEFFIDRGDVFNPDVESVCLYSCPVQIDCLETAINNDERHGFFGGLSVRDRRRIRLRRQAAGVIYGHGVGSGRVDHGLRPGSPQFGPLSTTPLMSFDDDQEVSDFEDDLISEVDFETDTIDLIDDMVIE